MARLPDEFRAGDDRETLLDHAIANHHRHLGGILQAPPADLKRSAAEVSARATDTPNHAVLHDDPSGVSKAQRKMPFPVLKFSQRDGKTQVESMQPKSVDDLQLMSRIDVGHPTFRTERLLPAQRPVGNVHDRLHGAEQGTVGRWFGLQDFPIRGAVQHLNRLSRLKGVERRLDRAEMPLSHPVTRSEPCVP